MQKKFTHRGTLFGVVRGINFKRKKEVWLRKTVNHWICEDNRRYTKAGGHCDDSEFWRLDTDTIHQVAIDD